MDIMTATGTDGFGLVYNDDVVARVRATNAAGLSG